MSTKLAKSTQGSLDRQVASSPRPSSRQGDVELLCICRQPYDSRRWMICCDRCNSWFHGTCIDIPEEAGALAVYFYCNDCCEKFGIQSVWRRKCRLPNCWKPARVDNQQSKYCCDDHGLQFFHQTAKNVMGADEKDIALLVHSAAALDGVTTLRAAEQESETLGTSKPTAPPELNDSDKARIQAIDNELNTLDKVKSHVDALSVEKTRETGRKIELCGYSSQWRHDETLPGYCQQAVQRCSEHSLWALIAERKLKLQKSRILHVDLVGGQNEVQTGPLGVTRYTREGKAYFTAL